MDSGTDIHTARERRWRLLAAFVIIAVLGGVGNAAAGFFTTTTASAVWVGLTCVGFAVGFAVVAWLGLFRR